MISPVFQNNQVCRSRLSGEISRAAQGGGVTLRSCSSSPNTEDLAMDRKRIQHNIKNLKMAQGLVDLAFQDLKNVEKFRESQIGSHATRLNILVQIDQAIQLATACSEEAPGAMTRLEAFRKICTEWNGKRLADKLTEHEFDEAVAFIEDNDWLAFLDFEYAANRWYLDKPTRPKQLTAMIELVQSANTRAYRKEEV